MEAPVVVFNFSNISCPECKGILVCHAQLLQDQINTHHNYVVEHEEFCSMRGQITVGFAKTYWGKRF